MSSVPQSPFALSRRKRAPRWLTRVLAVLAIAGLGWLIWLLVNDMSGVRRQAPSVSTIIPVPPPPPPPEKPPEPEKKVEEKVAEVEPLEPVQPKLDTPPKPENDLAQAMTMDTQGQAGTDAFNIGSGSGGGLSGTGSGRAGTATYGQYLAYALQRVLQSDQRTRRLVFKLSVDIWLDPGGRPTRVMLVQSSGNSQNDEAVLEVLRAIDKFDERPTTGLDFPVRVAISGRRPA